MPNSAHAPSSPNSGNKYQVTKAGAWRWNPSTELYKPPLFRVQCQLCLLQFYPTIHSPYSLYGGGEEEFKIYLKLMIQAILEITHTWEGTTQERQSKETQQLLGTPFWKLPFSWPFLTVPKSKPQSWMTPESQSSLPPGNSELQGSG